MRLRTLFDRLIGKPSASNDLDAGLNVVAQDRSAIERLRSGEYFPAGLAPRQFDLTDPYAKTMRIVNLIRELRSRNQGGTFLLVANPFPNLLFKLWQDQGGKPDPHMDFELIEQAKVRAHVLAMYDQLLYEAIQDFIDEEEGGSNRVEVHIMSELVPEKELFSLVEGIWDMCRRDRDFAERVYACVPISLRRSRHKKKNLTQLEGLPGNTFQEAWLRMGYVVHQIAYVLSLSSLKLGHAGEAAYDELTIEVAKRLNLAGGTRFDRGFGEVVGEGNPYAVVKQRAGVVRSDALSVADSFEPLIPEPSVVTVSGLPEGGWPELVASMQRAHDSKMMAIESLQGRISFNTGVYRRMLERVDKMDEGESRDKLREALAFRATREMVLSMNTGPYPWLEFVFEESGVMTVLNSGDLSNLGPGAGLLPYFCARVDGESDELYFVRFVNGLVHNGGPHFPPRQVKRDVLYWRDDGTRGRRPEMVDEEVGALFSLRKLLHGFASGVCSEVDVRSAAWTLDYRSYHWNLLHNDVPFIPGLDAAEFQVLRFDALKELFTLIRGNKYENVYRRLVGLPEDESLNEIEGGVHAMRMLLALPLLGNDIKAAFSDLKLG